MHTVLLIIHVLVALGLIGLVLMQQGKGADAGAAFGAGASATVFGSRGSASFLTRATAILATVFFVTSLSLAYLSGQRSPDTSIAVDNAPPAAEQAADVPAPAEQPSAPADVPVAPQQQEQ